MENNGSLPFWKRVFPVLTWMPVYKKKMLKPDVIAGVTLASFVLPGSMAYAGLAGLPPQAGIYCYIFGGLAFALFTTSRHVAVGPISSISLLVGTSLAAVSGGDPAKWMLMASLTALGVGVIALFAYLIKLSSLVNFIGETILLGFKAGAALSIASTVLPDLMGVTGGGSHFFGRIGNVISHVGDTNLAVLVFGLSIFILLIAGEKWAPGKPVSLIIVIASIALMAFTGLSELGIKTIGSIPSGLPFLQVPVLGAGEMATIVDLAFACFVLGYIETVSAARSLAIDHKYEIDVRQELISMGAANISVSLFGGYPVAGGLSQSAVNDKAGAKSPLSIIICSLVLILLLLFFTGLLKNLPKVLLSAIVLNAVLGLFKFKELKRLYHLNRAEFMVAMVALAGVLIFGILKGVMIAALLSLLMVIQKASHPYIARLGRIGNTHRYTDIERHPDNILLPGVIILRIEASVFYFNAQYVRDQILEAVNREETPARLLLLDLSASPWVDVSGSKMLLELSKTMTHRGIDFRIVEALASVRDMLRNLGLENKIGHISRKVTINDMVEDFLEEEEEKEIKN
jgi:high affinity sulfate transporter 1